MKLEDVIDPAKRRVRLVNGYATDGTETVTVGGVEMPAFWLAHVEAQEYDPIWVLVLDNTDTFSVAVVIGVNGKPEALLDQPLSGTVSSAPIGSDTVTVSTTNGSVDAAFGADYVPSVSDKVRLLWQDGNAWVLGKSAKIPKPKPSKPSKPKPSVPKPPTGSRAGSETFTASDSATWSTGTNSWNSYFKKDVYQGSYPGIGANRGAWFYHNKPTKLKGKQVTKAEIWVPRRARAGNYNSSVTMMLHLHYSSRRPGGDVSRFSTHKLSIPKGFRGGWKAIPASWGYQLTKGRGIGLSGGSYAGFDGVGSNKKSGQVRITFE